MILYPMFSINITHIIPVILAFLLILVGNWGCDSVTEDPGVNPIPPGLFDWSVQFTETTESIKDIHFVNATFGWAVGKQLVLATASGGSAWPEAPFESTSNPDLINSVYFINEQQGWMAGGINGDEGGKIFISQQGGAYPNLQRTFTNSLNTIFFLDEQMGWAAGAKGDVVNTMTGGLEWGVLANLGTEVFDIHFTTNSMGWAVGENGSVYQTTDGENFQLQNIGISTRLNAVHFTDTLHGWVCGEMNEVYRRHLSTDNQPIWTEVLISGVSGITNWSDIHFVDRLYGWVVGSEGKIYKTTDGGITWSRETSSTFENLNAIYMISKSKGWVAGDNGLILTYTP
jgi:photosystem II stability/assembly factor-like uncharacterized protein